MRIEHLNIIWILLLDHQPAPSLETKEEQLDFLNNKHKTIHENPYVSEACKKLVNLLPGLLYEESKTRTMVYFGFGWDVRTSDIFHRVIHIHVWDEDYMEISKDFQQRILSVNIPKTMTAEQYELLAKYLADKLKEHME